MNRQLAWVGVGLVAITTVIALGVIWVVGDRVSRELADFRRVLPALTELAFDARPGVTLVLLFGLGIAISAPRFKSAVLILVAVALLQLAVSVAYVVAWWRSGSL